MKEKIKPLVWDERTSQEFYHSAVADTPFGRFVITGRGWKKFDSPMVAQTPWGSCASVYNTVDLAKEWCEKEYRLKLAECFVEKE